MRWLALLLLLLLGACAPPPAKTDADRAAERQAEQAAQLPKDPNDAAVYRQLQAAGHDFSKPTLVDFTLYFPEESAARGVVQVLSAEGYRGDISLSGSEFMVHLQKEMSLTGDGIDMERFKMRELTVNVGGRYDGWGAEVRK
jgi:hypothetical protein